MPIAQRSQPAARKDRPSDAPQDEIVQEIRSGADPFHLAADRRVPQDVVIQATVAAARSDAQVRDRLEQSAAAHLVDQPALARKMLLGIAQGDDVDARR
jgi:hypothetical protein